ncbi:HAD superfamily hydrolase [Streptococcus sp. DD11]|uniref:HAD family hydrolase n=1 Tax=Streptococcus sp. DD11 TaxID=1777879 RepID=UPI00079B4DA6|nr:HAD family phosphatase [Streptococcus sp. DD11]KXT84982.1 HAD superfamily hydrolase [Streptococcus sp. DD11]
MIKNLVFDLGNVLIEWNPTKILTYFAADEEDRERVREAVFDSGLWARTDSGELSLEEASRTASALLPPELASAVQNIFYHWYEVVAVYQDLQKKIEAWSQQGYRIYILSTTCEIFYHIEKAGLLPIYPLLSGYILSSEVGAVKPDREIYLELLEKYHLQAEECVFIDDIEANLEAAADLGFATILAKSEAENIWSLEALLAVQGEFQSSDKSSDLDFLP